MSTSTRSRWARALAASLLAAFVSVAAARAGDDFRISPGPSSGSFLGSSIGLDMRGGSLHAAWGDNSAELAGNPDRATLDIGTAAVTVTAGGVTVGPSVYVTRAPLSQAGAALAIDPTDPDRIVAAALDAGPAAVRAFSRDGGATWTTVAGLPGNFGGFPPSVACDVFGNCFLLLVHDPDFGNPRLELFLSTDGGETFTPVPLPETPGIETNASLAVGAGSVWIGFQGYDNGVSLRTLAAPVSGVGAIGAFVAQALPGTADGRDPDIAVGPAGQALVVYEHGIFGTTPSVSVQLDADGLGSGGFGPRATVANVAGYPHSPNPRVAYSAGGRAVLVYEDREQPAASEEVLAHLSDDNGADWSGEIAVSDPVPSTDRHVPNVAVDPLTGTVAFAWYDLRFGSAELFGDVFQPLVAPATPRSPVDLAGTPVSQSRIDLSWSDVSDDETGFEIRRARMISLTQQEVVTFRVGPNVTSFSDTGLPAATGGSYSVRAFNGAGLSRPSNSVGVTTLAFPPDAPRNLTATAITFQRIDLDWDPVTNADSYEVEQSTNGVDFTIISRPIVTEMMIFGLRSQTTYFFRVRAVNSGGPSPNSNVASATTLGESQPAAPTELSAVALSNSKIMLMWRDNAVNETRFVIERSTGGGPFQRAGTAQANSQSVTQSFTDTGLRRETTYTYRVLACNGEVCSPPSNTAIATTPRR